jgi:tungstate transport system permease protein
MQSVVDVFNLLFGSDPELRGIIGVTLQLSLTSTVISCCIGIPFGMLLASYSFRGKKLILRFTHTLMGLPPVVAGLIVFFILSRSGPLGQYKLLYSTTAMIIAQILIITPIAAGLSASIAGDRLPKLRETVLGVNMSRRRQLIYTIYECRYQLFSVLFTGFGRAISEVGAAQIVGGNIQYKTRIMTTAIVQQTNMGYFKQAIALGILLFIISFIVTSTAHFFMGSKYDKIV